LCGWRVPKAFGWILLGLARATLSLQTRTVTPPAATATRHWLVYLSVLTTFSSSHQF